MKKKSCAHVQSTHSVVMASGGTEELECPASFKITCMGAFWLPWNTRLIRFKRSLYHYARAARPIRFGRAKGFKLYKHRTRREVDALFAYGVNAAK